MAGTTPNRGYRFPTDADDINPAVDIENLARDVDLDVLAISGEIDDEAAARLAADTALQTNIDNVIHVGEVDTGILIQASLGNALLDEVGKVVFPFPIPFTSPPIVVANNAVRDQNVVLGVEHSSVTATQCVVFGKRIDDDGGTGAPGDPAADTNVSFHWIAVGFRL